VLEKNLPIASGIGGGSADAAAALRVLSRLWGVEADLVAIAAGLGADVPVCVGSVPALMGGVGEVLARAPALPAFGMVLVNPGVAVSTPAVFRARAPGFRLSARLPDAWTSVTAMIDDLRLTVNDLEEPAMGLAPPIGEALTWLRGLDGCLLARMSGSGATCFGLFDAGPAAAQAARIAPSDWWTWGGIVNPQ
jgi:4-diphosphocytidyl-2-C-methyl-D-erythritol kinase